ncbi:hypothetical protein FRB94_010312 [Tulasnella sp. JGI-2019a]|nr:hypothetical protein FRB94_010312 [Tulasnella sp. JGI-2019a]
MAIADQVVSVPSIDDLVNSYISKSTDGLAGVAIMAIGKSNKIIYSGAFGKRTLDPAIDEAMTLDTVQWIASSTKLMTAVAVMQCVERGQIGLDDPVGNICPELAALEIIEGFSDDGTPKMGKAKKVITLRNLLSHTSGFSYHDVHPRLIQWIKSTGFAGQVVTGNIDAYKVPLVFEPGSDWSYGVGADWAGHIVERLNNCTLGEYMERNIWKPLGMNDTTFHPETRPDFGQRRAGLCIRTPNGALVPGPPRVYPTAGSPASDLGGIGLDSTCLDHGKFISAVLCDGCGILKKESIDEIFRPQFTGKTSPHPLYSSLQHHFGRHV